MIYMGFFIVGKVPFKSDYDLNMFVENSSWGFGFISGEL